MKKKFRHLMINGQMYLWRFRPDYLASGDLVPQWQCHDLFIAYLRHLKACPLQIHFLTWEDPVMGGPLRTGLPLDLAKLGTDTSGLNLHTPGHAAWIIRRALATGWKPEQSRTPFVIDDGVRWLMQEASI